MNFQFAAQGASFKGAMAYYTHDKRAPGMERNPTTSDRVAWAETRNMLTDRTDTATKIMISTAERAPELKREAGIKATGRQGTKPVAAFSLAWHPDEAKTLDREEMSRAADHALKVMGLEKCQAVIIAHRDTAHPHVHVVVNRVSPEDGRMAKIDPNRVRKLDRWANDYEKERGQIYSEKRAEKYDRIDERRKKHPEREDRARYIEEKRESAPERPQSAAQALRARSEALRVQGREDWKELGRSYAQGKSAVYDRWREPLKKEYDRQKVDAKQTWRAYFAEQRAQNKAREEMGRSVIGRLSLSIAAAREDIRSSYPGTRPGLVRLTFAYFLSEEHREQMFKKHQPREREALAADIKRTGEERIAELKRERLGELDQVRAEYVQGRESLIERQGKDRAEIRAAWKEIYREKGRDWTPRAQAEPKRELGREQERGDPARVSKFAWLDEREKAPETRSRFERMDSALEKARDKPKDQDRER